MIKKITIIGGGTGTFVLTRALQEFDCDITKIVAVFDSGGSTARLRDEFGFLPVGDLRQSLAALAKDNGQTWIRDLLLYRFSKGEGLEGHNLGNLILTALQDMTGSTPKALEVATKIFRLRGTVLPITAGSADLKVTYEDGTSLVGEHELDDMSKGGRLIRSVSLTKPCPIYQGAQKALLEADFIIIGPGDLYASIIPNFLVSGFRETLKRSSAKLIYVTNLMTRFTQTHNFSASKHLDEIEKYLGKPVDAVLVNTGKINDSIAKKYADQREYPVINDLPANYRPSIIAADFTSSVEVKKKAGDRLPRSLMRHDQNKLAGALKKILQ